MFSPPLPLPDESGVYFNALVREGHANLRYRWHPVAALNEFVRSRSFRHMTPAEIWEALEKHGIARGFGCGSLWCGRAEENAYARELDIDATREILARRYGCSCVVCGAAAYECEPGYGPWHEEFNRRARDDRDVGALFGDCRIPMFCGACRDVAAAAPVIPDWWSSATNGLRQLVFLLQNTTPTPPTKTELEPA